MKMQMKMFTGMIFWEIIEIEIISNKYVFDINWSNEVLHKMFVIGSLTGLKWLPVLCCRPNYWLALETRETLWIECTLMYVAWAMLGTYVVISLRDLPLQCHSGCGLTDLDWKIQMFYSDSLGQKGVSILFKIRSQIIWATVWSLLIPLVSVKFVLEIIWIFMVSQKILPV